MAEGVAKLAFDVYQYTYPLVMMDVTMRQATNVPDTSTVAMRAPVNQFAHARTYPPAEATDVVRFNFDTLYSMAWLDLRDEPMVLSLPEGGDRYHLVPLYDMWTDIFAVPGTRTTGGHARHLGLAAPGWSGTLPDGVDLVHAPTPIMWILGRTQTNGPKDYAAVNAFQDGYRLTPLSAWGRPHTPPTGQPVDPTVDDVTSPQTTVNAMSGVELLTRFAELLKVNPPHAADYPILMRMRALGLEPGKDFHPDPATASAVDAAAKEALADLAQALATGSLGEVRGGWSSADNLGAYGVSYRLRALVALAGLGANLPEDAIYPNCVADADGEPTTGAHDYVLRFEKGHEPQADAFWSLTMYDEHGFQVPNPLDRFVLRDRDDLVRGPDGSLELYVQHASPGPDKVANWLPAPEGPFAIMIRIYSPAPELLRAGVTLPPLRKVR